MPRKSKESKEVQSRPRQRLATERYQRGWSQQELADRLGTTPLNVSRWERGLTTPNPYFRQQISTLFGLSAGEMDLIFAPAISQEQATVAPTDEEAPLYDPNMPRSTFTLIGREEELARLKSRLFAGQRVALSALHGLPGVGKTALALQVARDPETQERFPAGVLWAALGPAPNVQSILSHWGDLLGLRKSEMASLNRQEDWVERLRMLIGQRRLLLVLDDAWQEEVVRACMVGGPACSYIVTTRFPQLAQAFTSNTEDTLTVPTLSPEASLHLLHTLAPQVIAGSRGDGQAGGQESIPEDVAALIEAVGGLPLALTLIGNYLRLQAHDAQPRRIRAALQLMQQTQARLALSEPLALQQGLSTLPGATLSLQAVIATSKQRLSPVAQSAFSALAVLPAKPESFSEEAALAVCQATVETLDELSDAGLLESIGPGRYTLHQTIADYARVQPQDDAVLTRLITYSMSYIKQYEQNYAFLEQEHAVLLAALEAVSTRRQHEKLISGSLALAPFWLARGYLAVAEHQLERAYDVARTADDNKHALLLLSQRCTIAYRLGDANQWERQALEGLALARQINDPALIALMLTEMGTMYNLRGELNQAIAYLQEALTLGRASGDQSLTCRILGLLCGFLSYRGDYSQAESYAVEALEIARRIQDEEKICFSLMEMGVVAAYAGQLARSQAHFEEALAMARQLEQREWMANLLDNLGSLATDERDYQRAEKYILEALDIARQIGHRERVGSVLVNLGLLMIDMKEYARAATYLEEALEQAQRVGMPRLLTTAYYASGDLYLAREQAEEAGAMFEKILISGTAEEKDMLALAQYGLARVALVQGDTQLARQLGGISVASMEEMGYYRAPMVREWLSHLSEQQD